jgi:acetyl-CoA acyltransferase 1
MRLPVTDSPSYNISRESQDVFATRSFQKAEAAQKAGKFDSEITPVTVNGVTVTRDDCLRYGVTADSLTKLKPAFKADGTTTAANASQLTDGAAAIILARRSVAEKHGLPIIGKVCKVISAGVPPRIMGVGPAVAIPALLNKAALTVGDIDIFEINEAFAGQALYCAQQLKFDMNKLNPCGGAIALGHPLGATGARQVCTALAEARRTNAQFFVTSMCAGTGFGVAGLFVNEQPASKL